MRSCIAGNGLLSKDKVYSMILDNYITYTHKVVFSVICSGFWIYFRTSENYNFVPRQHIFPVIFVMCWTYLNYYEPLFLPLGLGVLIVYTNIDIYSSKKSASDDSHNTTAINIK